MRFFGVDLGMDQARFQNWRQVYLRMFGIESRSLLSIFSSDVQFLENMERDIFSKLTVPVDLIQVPDGRFFAYAKESIGYSGPSKEAAWAQDLQRFCDQFQVHAPLIGWMPYCADN